MNLRETLFNPTRGKDFGCPVRRLLQSSRGKTNLVAARIFSTFIFHPELCRGRPTGSMPQFFWSSEARYTGAQVAGASQCWTLPAVVLFGDRGWNSILSGIPAPHAHPGNSWEVFVGDTVPQDPAQATLCSAPGFTSLCCSLHRSHRRKAFVKLSLPYLSGLPPAMLSYPRWYSGTSTPYPRPCLPSLDPSSTPPTSQPAEPPQ